MNHPLEKKSLSVAGVETHYLEQGAGDTTMVLLHNGLFSKDGFCADALAWECNIASLARDFRVIAVDLKREDHPGLGEVLPLEGAHFRVRDVEAAVHDRHHRQRNAVAVRHCR